MPSTAEDRAPRPVRVVDAGGRLLFNRLLDDGSPRLRFATGPAYVERDDLAARGCRVVPLWLADAPAVGG
jgi:hypothetical protein